VITAASHAGTAPSLIDTLLGYWWVFFLFGGAALEWLGETFGCGLGALRRRSKLKHKRRLELKRLELRIAAAKAGVLARAQPKPGPCVHRNVRPVVADDEVVGWLCACDAQLPADWAVREEDL